jgi:hypothetical protein
MMVNRSSLHPDVEAELATRFSGPDLIDATVLLETTPLSRVRDPASLDAARIHMAAIKFAEGSMDKLKAAMKLAAEDWRDLLVSAGLPHADWREVLASGGFRVPR